MEVKFPGGDADTIPGFQRSKEQRLRVVTVKFLASLREEFGCSDTRTEVQPGMTVSDVWTRIGAGRPFPSNVLAAVNLDYVGRDHPVDDGDEVAFFPPVTGG